MLPLLCQVLAGCAHPTPLLPPDLWKDGFVFAGEGHRLQRLQRCLLALRLPLLLPLLLLLLLPLLRRRCRRWLALGGRGCRRRSPRQHATRVPHIGNQHKLSKHPGGHRSAAVCPAVGRAALQHSSVQLLEALHYRSLAGLDAGLLRCRHCCRLLLRLLAAACVCTGGPCCCCRGHAGRLLLQPGGQAAGVEVLRSMLRHAAPSVAVEHAEEGQAGDACACWGGLSAHQRIWADHRHVCG